MRVYWIKAQAPRRVLALIKHLGIDAECVEMDLMGGGLTTPDYVALNPNRKAPVLVDDNVTLWESSAIMAYLCIKQASDMWPANDPSEQVEVLRWLSWNDGHWAPAVAPFYFEYVVRSTFGLGLPDCESLKERASAVLKYGKILDAHLEGRNEVACGRLTIADFQLGSMAAEWQRAEMPFETFPNIVRWLDRLAHIPAWADPWPAKLPAAA